MLYAPALRELAYAVAHADYLSQHGIFREREGLDPRGSREIRNLLPADHGLSCGCGGAPPAQEEWRGLRSSDRPYAAGWRDCSKARADTGAPTATGEKDHRL